MAEVDDESELASELAVTEKYRTRSRSVAALTAAAAGALAAGLAINPALVAFPLPTRILGLAAVLLLVLATGAFVVASLLHGRSMKANAKTPSWISRFLRPWEALFSSESEWPSTEEYRNSIETVQRLIMRATDIGMWIATGAIVALVSALLSMLVLNEQTTAVSIAVLDGSPATEMCPALPARFDATVRTIDLDSAAETLKFEIAGSLCQAGLDDQAVELTVLRTELSVATSATP